MIMKRDLLKEYNSKRDFKTTKEPSGKTKITKRSKKLSFVVQEHHARRLHYDFRLEWEGVLKSWAVPKGPSSDPSDKRLAVQTEDHPLEYGKFHGTIPAGEYGAGEVFIWDEGTWEPIGDPEIGLRKGHLEFNLKGGKLQGRWMLIRTHFKGRDDKQNWLLLKRADKPKANGLSDPWPDFISPQLPRLVTSAPAEAGWIHEMKFDGYRMQGHLQNGLAHLYTRNALDWSNAFPHILEGLGRLRCESAILDGEIVALDEDGLTHFQRLQNSLKFKNDKDLRYYVFDIMYLDGKDLRALPLVERKDILKALLKKSPKHIIYSEHFMENGEEFYRLACEHHLEGIVSKLADSPYRSGRNDLWSKTKCTFRQEFVIGGWTDAQGGRTGFGALLLGVYQDGKLRYTGRVGTGFDHQGLRDIRKTLSALEVEDSPFEVNSPKGKGLHWTRPIKVCEVSFAQWTDEGILRTPVFMGLREDKPAREVAMERAIENISGTGISSPDKILFKKEKLTKLQVFDYYQAIASFLVPYLADRPLSLVRCPDGSDGTCFYQKHITGKVPESFNTFPVKENKGTEIYFSINSAKGLRDLVQLNAFEIHGWNCHYENLMNPDQIVMDFDPGPGVPWKEVVSAAFELKEMLDDLGLESFVKLTGGKGLHVHIPIAPIYDWEQIKSFSQTLALQMVSGNPRKYVAKMSRKVRKGKIFVDYLRNTYGATVVVPYSLRAKPLSAVALPLDWKELSRLKGPSEYTLDKALKKIKTRKVDPWKGMLKLKQKIRVLEQMNNRKVA